MEYFVFFIIPFIEKSSPPKKEFRKKPSSISLDLVLQQDSIIAINAPVVEIPSVPKEKSVETEVLLKQSSQEKAKVEVDLHDKPKEEERKEKVKEEEKPVEVVVAEPEPKFSKINIGDEPKKTGSVMNKQATTAKKESKMMDHHHHFGDDDKRVSSAGSSSSSSSGAELYVGNVRDKYQNLISNI